MSCNELPINQILYRIDTIKFVDNLIWSTKDRRKVVRGGGRSSGIYFYQYSKNHREKDPSPRSEEKRSGEK